MTSIPSLNNVNGGEDRRRFWNHLKVMVEYDGDFFE